MSFISYRDEQERMLRHKIGDELYNLLDGLIDVGIDRGRYGVDKKAKRTAKVELRSLSQNGIRSDARKENAKPLAGNDT